MNPKTTRLWILVAAALFAFIFFYQRHAGIHSPGPRKPLSDLSAAAVTGILVRTQGEAQIRVVLTNVTWQLTEPISDLANGPAIQKLVRALDQLTAATYITPQELRDSARARDEYGFAPQCLSLSLQQGEQKLPQLKIGRRTNPGDQIFVQTAGDAGIYVVDAAWLDFIPRSANAWRDPILVNLTNIVFDRIAVSSKGATFELLRDANFLWRMVAPVPSRADNPRIIEGLLRLHSMRGSQFVPDSPKLGPDTLGLAPPELEIGLNQGATNAALLQFGKTNEAGQVYACRAGRNAIFAVPAEMIAQWWRATPNDFRDRHLLTLLAGVEAIEVRGEDNFSVQHQTNNAWRVLPQNFPADAGLVGEMLSQLTNMPIMVFKEDVVTDLLLPRYGLAKPLLRVLLFGSGFRADGTNGLLADVSFGSDLDAQVYALRGDEAPLSHIYTINTNDFIRLPAASWQLRERRLWNFSTNDITGVTIRHLGKTRQMARRGPYKWSMVTQGEIVNELAVEEIVRGLSEVEAVAWAARGKQSRGRFGFTEDGHQIIIELKSGNKATVEFGGAALSGMPYAGVTVAGDFWIFEFPPALYQQVVGYLSIPPGTP